VFAMQRQRELSLFDERDGPGGEAPAGAQQEEHQQRQQAQSRHFLLLSSHDAYDFSNLF